MLILITLLLISIVYNIYQREQISYLNKLKRHASITPEEADKLIMEKIKNW